MQPSFIMTAIVALKCHSLWLKMCRKRKQTAVNPGRRQDKGLTVHHFKPLLLRDQSSSSAPGQTVGRDRGRIQGPWDRCMLGGPGGPHTPPTSAGRPLHSPNVRGEKLILVLCRRPSGFLSVAEVKPALIRCHIDPNWVHF